MSLSITRSRIKEKCGIFDSTYDVAIDALIAEFTPVIEFAILDEALGDSSNAGLQATLNLGATEIVCGELIAQQARENAVFDQVSIGFVSLRPGSDLRDPSGLIERGAMRLRPYLKAEAVPSVATVRTIRPEAR